MIQAPDGAAVRQEAAKNLSETLQIEWLICIAHN